MLWIINGLVYGFFMALYTLVNQRHKFNGYVLGVWRGFGISFLFLPFLFFVPLQTDLKNWYLLVIQGLLIGIYDSHIFFASARYGASVTSKLLVLSVLVTTLMWWAITPELFLELVKKENVFIVLVNSEKYGGGGVYNCFAIGSVESEDWVEVMMHELGHSFAGLADEYYYEGETSPDMYSMDVEPWEPNITTLVDFDKKWKRLYDSKEVELIEGAAYNAKGLYRSESNCKMRELHIPFCKVCNEAIENRIKRYIE